MEQKSDKKSLVAGKDHKNNCKSRACNFKKPCCSLDTLINIVLSDEPKEKQAVDVFYAIRALFPYFESYPTFLLKDVIDILCGRDNIVKEKLPNGKKVYCLREGFKFHNEIEDITGGNGSLAEYTKIGDGLVPLLGSSLPVKPLSTLHARKSNPKRTLSTDTDLSNIKRPNSEGGNKGDRYYKLKNKSDVDHNKRRHSTGDSRKERLSDSLTRRRAQLEKYPEIGRTSNRDYIRNLMFDNGSGRNKSLVNDQRRKPNLEINDSRKKSVFENCIGRKHSLTSEEENARYPHCRNARKMSKTQSNGHHKRRLIEISIFSMEGKYRKRPKRRRYNTESNDGSRRKLYKRHEVSGKRKERCGNSGYESYDNYIESHIIANERKIDYLPIQERKSSLLQPLLERTVDKKCMTLDVTKRVSTVKIKCIPKPDNILICTEALNMPFIDQMDEHHKSIKSLVYQLKNEISNCSGETKSSNSEILKSSQGAIDNSHSSNGTKFSLNEEYNKRNEESLTDSLGGEKSNDNQEILNCIQKTTETSSNDPKFDGNEEPNNNSHEHTEATLIKLNDNVKIVRNGKNSETTNYSDGIKSNGNSGNQEFSSLPTIVVQSNGFEVLNKNSPKELDTGNRENIETNNLDGKKCKHNNEISTCNQPDVSDSSCDKTINPTSVEKDVTLGKIDPNNHSFISDRLLVSLTEFFSPFSDIGNVNKEGSLTTSNLQFLLNNLNDGKNKLNQSAINNLHMPSNSEEDETLGKGGTNNNSFISNIQSVCSLNEFLSPVSDIANDTKEFSLDNRNLQLLLNSLNDEKSELNQFLIKNLHILSDTGKSNVQPMISNKSVVSRDINSLTAVNLTSDVDLGNASAALSKDSSTTQNESIKYVEEAYLKLMNHHLNRLKSMYPWFSNIEDQSNIICKCCQSYFIQCDSKEYFRRNSSNFRISHIYDYCKFHSKSPTHWLSSLFDAYPNIRAPLSYFLMNNVQHITSFPELLSEIKKIIKRNISTEIRDAMCLILIKFIRHFIERKLLLFLQERLLPVSLVVDFCREIALVRVMICGKVEEHIISLKREKAKTWSEVIDSLKLDQNQVVSRTFVSCGHCEWCKVPLETSWPHRYPSKTEFFQVLNEDKIFQPVFTFMKVICILYASFPQKFNKVDGIQILDNFKVWACLDLVVREHKVLKEICLNIYNCHGNIEALGLAAMDLTIDEKLVKTLKMIKTVLSEVDLLKQSAKDEFSYATACNRFAAISSRLSKVTDIHEEPQCSLLKYVKEHSLYRFTFEWSYETRFEFLEYPSTLRQLCSYPKALEDLEWIYSKLDRFRTKDMVLLIQELQLLGCFLYETNDQVYRIPVCKIYEMFYNDVALRKRFQHASSFYYIVAALPFFPAFVERSLYFASNTFELFRKRFGDEVAFDLMIINVQGKISN